MLAQIQDNTHKAYVALQSYVTSPGNIPIPGVVHTDRPKLTRDQMAARYLKSVEGNPDIDINKVGERQQQKTPKMVQKSSDAKTKDQWTTLWPCCTQAKKLLRRKKNRTSVKLFRKCVGTPSGEKRDNFP